MNLNFTNKTILSLFLIFLFSCNNSEKIEGKWFVAKFEKLNGETKKSSEKWVEFFENGTLNGGKKNESEIKKGTWNYNTRKGILTIESENNYGDEGVYIIEKLSEKEMVLVKDSTKIFFNKWKKKH